jgi:hypothetical protein
VRDEHAAFEPRGKVARDALECGASASISLSMPVSAVMPAGNVHARIHEALPFEIDTSPVAPMTATSITRCMPGVQPVVSMSTKATGD